MPSVAFPSFGSTLVETERRILVPHEQHVGRHTGHPPIEPEHEIEDPRRVARGEEERDAGEEHDDADQANVEAGTPCPFVDLRRREASASEEDADDDEVGIARSQDFTSTSPRDSRSGYATSSRAG